MGRAGDRLHSERRKRMTTENMIWKLMDDYNVAGMSVALIRDGEIVSIQG